MFVSLSSYRNCQSRNRNVLMLFLSQFVCVFQKLNNLKRVWLYCWCNIILSHGFFSIFDFTVSVYPLFIMSSTFVV